MKLALGVATAAATLAIVTGIAVSLSSTPKANASTRARDAPRLDGNAIRFSPEFARRAKIRFEPCRAEPFAAAVTVTGTVSFDPQRMAAIGARIPGRVVRIRKFPGDRVKAGETVAEIESADLAAAHANLVGARARAEAAVADDARQSRLAEQQVSSQRDAELAHAAAHAARASATAAEQRLRAMGASGANVDMGILPLSSPIDGKVIELRVLRGQTVEPAETAMRVADLSRVWVELAVFERELARVRRGDVVQVTPQANRKLVLEGKIAHIGDVIDVETRSAHVRVELDNGEGKLRVGESVVAIIRTERPGTALLVPREAIALVDGVSTVFVADDGTSVEPRKVELGAKDGANVEVRGGLTVGDLVVVSGVGALKSEVFR